MPLSRLSPAESSRSPAPVADTLPKGVDDDARIVAFDELLQTDEVGRDRLGRQRSDLDFQVGSNARRQVIQRLPEGL